MIETNRLKLLPLSHAQLLKYLKCDISLEDELGLKPTERIISDELKEAFEQSILPNTSDDSKNYLFYTLWSIIIKDAQIMAGDLCFHGAPDENGIVEIGYGTYEEFRNKGIMSEALSGLINWARTNKEIKSLFASTEKNNIPSYSVLKRNNFVCINETELLFNWQLKIE